MAGFGSYQNPEIIQQQTLVTSIPVGQWSGSDGNYYITVTASGITADSIIVPNYDKDSATALQGPIWCVPGAGSFTINTTKLPTNTVNIMTQFAGTMGVANYQVLADVYSRSQIDNKIANDLSTTVEGKILDARQGKILNDKFSNVYNKNEAYSKTEAVAKADIVNNLTTPATTEDKVLDARQGKALYDMLTTNMITNLYGSQAFAITAGGTIGEYLESQTFTAAPIDGYIVRFAAIEKFKHPDNYLPLLSTDVNAGTARVDIYRTSTTAINLSAQDFLVRFYYVRV